MNGIPHEEKLTNLAILVNDDAERSHTIVDLPTNDNVSKILNSDKHQEPNDPGLKVNHMCIVVWQNPDAKCEWYVAYEKKTIPGGFEVDHLDGVNKNVNNKWKYPSNEDIKNIQKEKIVQCTVECAWDITPDSRKRYFTLNK